MAATVTVRYSELPPPAEALELSEAVDRVRFAWGDLAAAVCRRIEGWDDPPERVQAALEAVRDATRARINALVDRALAKGGG